MKPFVIQSFQRLIVVLTTVFMYNLPGYAEESTIRIESDGIIYTSSDNISFSASGLTDEGKTKTVLQIPSSIDVEGSAIPVQEVSFKSDVVTEIRFASRINFVSPFTNLPNLESVVYIGNSTDDITEDGVYYMSQNGQYFLRFYPPAKSAGDYVIPEGVTHIYLDGNKYLKTLTIPSTTNSISISQDFPELSEIRVHNNNPKYTIIDGALFSYDYKKQPVFVHFPIKYSDTFIVPENAVTLSYWPNVKNIIINSPYITPYKKSYITSSLDTRSILLGDNVESLVFTKPTEKISDWDDGGFSYGELNNERTSITGKNLTKVVLPENIGFSPSMFANFQLTKKEQLGTVPYQYYKYYYKVSYPEKLAYVKGGWLEGCVFRRNNGDPIIGIAEEGYEGVNKNINIFEGDASTTDTRYWRIYPSKIEFHLSDPHEYKILPNDFNSSELPIYYDNILHSLEYVSTDAHGVKVDWDVISYKNLSDFKQLRNLDIYFPDNFTGLGNSLFGYIFNASSSYLASVTQYQEDGTTINLRRPANLRHVGLYGNIEYIPYGYFSNFISLESVSLPSSMITVGDKSFYGCSKLKELKVLADYPPVAYESTFTGVRTSMTHLQVPSEGVDLYKSDDIWKKFFVEAAEASSLSVNKSILEAGQIETDFSGEFGDLATLNFSVSPGYKFIGWFDQNLSYLSSSRIFQITIYEPTVINAIFLPSEDSNEINYSWNDNNDLTLSIPMDTDASSYRISCYSGSIQGSPAVVETFPASTSHILSRGNNTDFSASIGGLSRYSNYSVVIDVLNNANQVIRAYLKQIYQGDSGIEDINEDTTSFYINGRTLSVSSSSPYMASAYTLEGRLIFNYAGNEPFETEIPTGFVILRINNKVYKVVIQ